MKRLSRVAIIVLPAFGILGLSGGCELKEDDVDPGPISQVSLFHTSPNAPNLDIIVDDVRINNVPFEYGKTTEYVRFSSGIRNLKLRPYGGGTIFIDTTITLEPDKAFSLFVIDDFDKASVMLLFDDPDVPAAGNARIRFINLSPDSEALQLRIKDVALALTVGQSFTDASQFMDLEAKTYDFEITSAGTKVLELPGSVLQDGWFYTIYVIGYVTPPTGNTNVLSAQVFIN
ncbi:MAG TPA: DUF4397 domain-containing protein [Chryseolinea sp.]|nr:DUF4397 domain-containing protein [Chryseolinea sp.]